MVDPVRTISLEDVSDLEQGREMFAPWDQRSNTDRSPRAGTERGEPEPSQKAVASPDLTRWGMPESVPPISGLVDQTPRVGGFISRVSDARRILYVLLFLVLSAAIIFLLYTYKHLLPFEGFDGLSLTENATSPVPEISRNKGSAPSLPQILTKESTEKKIERRASAPPYQLLPNPLRRSERVIEGQALNRFKLEAWRSRLNEPVNLRYDTYLRYRTVQEIRASHMQGSGPLLREALQLPKFWARMEASLGLAELGLRLSEDEIRTVFSQTRSSLVTSYFKRFHKSPQEPELYLLRQALRVVEPKVRRAVLEILVKRPSRIHDFYLYAATLDPHADVRATGVKLLRARPASKEVIETVQGLIAGEIDPATIEAAEEKFGNDRFVKDIEVEEVGPEIDIESIRFLDE